MGMAGLMLAGLFLRLLLVMVPIMVVCRIMALIGVAAVRSQHPAEPRRAVGNGELQSLVQVGPPHRTHAATHRMQLERRRALGCRLPAMNVTFPPVFTNDALD